MQGGEKAALEGAVNKLKNKEIHYILSEISFISQYKGQPIASDIINLLDSLGYDLLNLYQVHYYEGCMIQADAIFVERSYHVNKRAKNESLFSHTHDSLSISHEGLADRVMTTSID